MRALFFYTLLSLALIVPSVGQSVRIYDVEAFSKLKIKGPYRVNVTKDSRHQVTLEGDEEMIRYTTVRIKGEWLEIIYDRDKVNWGTTSRMIINVSYRDLTALEASGASTVTLESQITGQSFELDASGASSVTADVNVNRLNVTLTGASTLTLSGRSATFSTEVSGASTCKGRDFDATSANVVASGASTVTISANDELNVKANGASTVNYHGKATKVDINSSGASTVRRRD